MIRETPIHRRRAAALQKLAAAAALAEEAARELCPVGNGAAEHYFEAARIAGDLRRAHANLESDAGQAWTLDRRAALRSIPMGEGDDAA